jgi:NAD(P)-dependent dehydrogenase (short-subunit alcohol dehydrogenase family)
MDPNLMSDVTRVAVVTGANRGMGWETARQLTERGMTVLLTARDPAKGEQSLSRLRDVLGARADAVSSFSCDVTDAAAVDALAAHVRTTYGRLDVLVNNAGAILDPHDPSDPKPSSFFDSDLDAIRQSFALNTMGAVLTCRALVPIMRENGYGRVVNVSTGMAALNDMGAGFPGYRMSKTALNALTRLLGVELASSGIKVNAVCPGHVMTDMGGKSATRTVEEGVDTTVWLATLHDDGPTGGFFRDCKALAW